MKHRYLNIPYEVLNNQNFDAENKILISEIISLHKLPNGCIKSDEKFGQLVNLKRTAVNGRMNALVKAGYIKRIHLKNRTTVKTVLSKNFWELVKKGIIEEKKDEQELNINRCLTDTKCHPDHLECVIETDISSHQDDTINTITNTNLKLQEEAQNTGEIENVLVENNDLVGERVIELMCISPAQLLNPFLIKFQDSLFELDTKFGPEIIDKYHILKSNKELYEIYGFENFSDVRQHLTFVKENMDKFLRYKRLK